MPNAGLAQETVRATTGAPVALPSHSLMPRAPDFPTWANMSYVGPLTTIFTPPATWTEIQAVATRTGSTDPWTLILSYARYWKGATDGRKENCLSTDFDELNRDGVLPVFSPGHGCPVGYGSVCAIVAPGAAITAGSVVQVWDRMPIDKTAVGCCPRAYTCDSFSCRLEVLTGARVTAWEYVGRTDSTTLMAFTSNSLSQLRVEAEKLMYIEEEVTTAATTAMPTTATTPTAEATAHAARDGPTPAIKPPIGASVSLGTIALALVGWLLYRRRSKKQTSAARADSTGYTKAEPDASTAVNANRTELDGSSVSVFELPAGNGQQAVQRAY
ncbi:hypothetical protein LEL_10315 [Akanthomyces lecanii RCEF 1005]|uniref:Uncharacterized protein n=1 Tax=Akanthomyces lecanii RCEF 1005 TaxID=1081108 RepID=A0A162JEB4_CORDF|nr:hypothetical protein LEL_10315 [Akanthomyces lecanii RCEF 1005]